MKTARQPRFVAIETVATALFLMACARPSTLLAKDKTPAPDPNDPTLRLFQLIDDSRGGKLTEFYVLADTYKDKDANNQDIELQHVLLVEYDKTRAFGKLNLHVRSVSKLAPEQLKTYTLKQIYDFGGDDMERFVKTEAGELGRSGDLYVISTGDRPPASAPITEEARKQYELFLTQYVLPALKNGDAGFTSAALAKHDQ